MADPTLRRRELMAGLAGALYVLTGCGEEERRPAPVPPAPPPGFVRAAAVDELRLGDYRPFDVVFPEPAGRQPLLLALRRDGAGARAEAVALHARCTHKGCPVRWVKRSRKLICPCHGGVFDEHGSPEGGPVRFPLLPVETRTEDGVVYVATGSAR